MPPYFPGVPGPTDRPLTWPRSGRLTSVTAIPVLAPLAAPVLAQPYLTDDAFRAYPHWLDLDNLIPGGVEALQAGELADVLLAASDACITLDEGRLMRLDGHYVQDESHELPLGQDGRITVRPRDVPVRGLVSVAYGADPSDMICDPLPNPTGWLTSNRQYAFRPGGTGQPRIPPVLGTRRLGRRAFISLSYVAGYPSTTLSTACVASSPSVTLADATGVLPGDSLMIYDVGQSEAVTVAPAYVPLIPQVPPVPSDVPLTVSTQSAHAEGILVTGMPRAILQAVICFAIAFLMREDVSDEEPVDVFGSGKRSTSYGRGGQAGGLINDALGYLEPYRPGWRP